MSSSAHAAINAVVTATWLTTSDDTIETPAAAAGRDVISDVVTSDITESAVIQLTHAHGHALQIISDTQYNHNVL